MLDNEVLIVGAGPTGLNLALFLAKSGIKPRIIDQNSGPGLQSRAMGVHARTLEFYRQLGFADEVVNGGIEIRAINMWAKGVHAAEINIDHFGGSLSPYPYVLSYPQDEHEKLLTAKLKEAGIEVEWSTELGNFEQIGDVVNCMITKNGGYEEKISVGYLCGCDGAHSKVRTGLHLDFGGGTYDQTYYVADVEASGGAASQPGGLNFCVTKQAFVLLLPIRSTGMQRLIGVVPDELAAKEDLNFDDVRPFAEEAGNLNIAKVNWFSKYRVHHRVTEHFKVGRAFLLGDAGHIHSPVGGQGMNTGIGDAVNLSWKLAEVIQGRANRSILDTYEPERIAFAHALLSTTDKVFSLMNGADIGHQFFRETIFPHLMPFLLGFSDMRTGAFKLLSQTQINYRDSKLSHGHAGDVRGGDRLPWVVFNEGTDNFQPLRSFDWQIHVYGEAGDELRHASRALNIPLLEFDWTNHVEAAGFIEDSLYLVRPDGYVGFADSSQDIGAFETYMKQFNLVSGKLSSTPSNETVHYGGNTGLPQEQPVGTIADQPEPTFEPVGPGSLEHNQDVISDPTYDRLAQAPNQMPVM